MPVRVPDLAVDARGPRRHTGVDVRWRFFSLEEVNRVEGKKHPWEREWSYGWSMMRIGAYLRRQDMDLLDRWYLVAGQALHEDGRKPHRPEVAEALLGEMGLDPAIVSKAIEDPTTGDEVQAEHDAVLAKGGFGVPTLVFDDGQALFGPVLVNPPTGAEAVRLWEHVTGWLEFPNVYELQRPKTPPTSTPSPPPSPRTSKPGTGSRSNATPPEGPRLRPVPGSRTGGFPAGRGCRRPRATGASTSRGPGTAGPTASRPPPGRRRSPAGSGPRSWRCW